MLSSGLRRLAATTITRGLRLQAAAPVAARSFSVLGARRYAADTDIIKDNFGPGAKPGTIPTDLEQATGLERAELIGKLEGKDIFDMSPLEITHLGTKNNPIIVKSKSKDRIIGCSGYPADSHDPIALMADSAHEFDRCPECGCVFKLDFAGTDDHSDGHHH